MDLLTAPKELAIRRAVVDEVYDFENPLATPEYVSMLEAAAVKNLMDDTDLFDLYWTRERRDF